MAQRDFSPTSQEATGQAWSLESCHLPGPGPDLPSGATGKNPVSSFIVALAQHSCAHHAVLEEVSSCTYEDRVGKDYCKVL